MVPKRGADRSSTRERVIQAADRLWGANGVRGASLDDIAREASVTKPTVYYYFANKSALFTAVQSLSALSWTGNRNMQR